jgi:hypothetical protein
MYDEARRAVILAVTGGTVGATISVEYTSTYAERVAGSTTYTLEAAATTIYDFTPPLDVDIAYRLVHVTAGGVRTEALSGTIEIPSGGYVWLTTKMYSNSTLGVLLSVRPSLTYGSGTTFEWSTSSTHQGRALGMIMPRQQPIVELGILTQNGSEAARMLRCFDDSPVFVRWPAPSDDTAIDIDVPDGWHICPEFSRATYGFGWSLWTGGLVPVVETTSGWSRIPGITYGEVDALLGGYDDYVGAGYATYLAAYATFLELCEPPLPALGG